MSVNYVGSRISVTYVSEGAGHPGEDDIGGLVLVCYEYNLLYTI
jgi:hypothetical protein